MIKGQPSRTAMLTAVQRAHHHAFAPEPKVLRDDMALALTGLGSPAAVQAYIDAMTQKFASISDAETGARLMSRIDSSVCMRSRVVEEKLALARDNGIKQIVILGAGLDSMAYRRLDLTEGLQVFEVDHPATQQWKKEQLAKAEISIPENVSFTAFDFENETLPQALAAGGVNPDAPTFFTWLGVQMYLTDEAVCFTLSVMGRYPKGSELVMDFLSPTYSTKSNTSLQSVENLRKVVATMGEPMKSKYTQPELEAILNSSGFPHVDFLSAGWLTENYLGGDSAAFTMPEESTSILFAQI